MRENKWGKALRILMIVIICAACLIPFYVLLVLSLNAPSRVFYEGNIFVPNFHWQNFIDAWKKSKIGTAMLNSAIITAGTLGVSVIAGGLAGYAIARYATRYNKFVFGLLIGCKSTLALPPCGRSRPCPPELRALPQAWAVWVSVDPARHPSIPARGFHSRHGLQT